MHETSALYKRILAGTHWVEWKLDIAGTEYINEFYGGNIKRSQFPDKPTVGLCCAGELNCKLKNVSSAQIPRGAEIKPYFRLRAEPLEVPITEDNTSEWIQKGDFYLYERTPDVNGREITLHAYDAILRLESQFTSYGDQGTWPMVDVDAAQEIAQRIGVEIDPRTIAIMTDSAQVPYPGIGENAHTMREVMGSIAARYARNWIINDYGMLQLVSFWEIPQNIKYLLEENGEAILIGGVKIIV